MKTPQGVLDLKKWDCAIPGKDKTMWEGGLFKLEVQFPDGEGKVTSYRYSHETDAGHRVPYETTKVYVLTGPVTTIIFGY